LAAFGQVFASTGSGFEAVSPTRFQETIHMKTTITKSATYGTLAVLMASMLATPAIQPAQAKGFIRRHPFVTAGAVGAGALMYRHHQKKKARRAMRAQGGMQGGMMRNR